MNVTFILPPVNLSGGIRVIAIYAERLSQMGHTVEVIAVSKPSPTPVQQLKSILKGQGWIPSPSPPPSHFDGRSVSLRILPHSGPVTDHDVPDADVVVATWWETAPWVAGLSPTKGAKAYFMQDYGKGGQALEDVVPTWSLPLHIITISEWLADLVREYRGDIPMTVVPNAVDHDRFYASPRSKQPVPTVGLAYRSAPSKGIDIALDAITRAQRILPHLQGVAFGPEPPTADLQLPARTEFSYRPSDEQIRILYAQCDMWLFPSRREGFGLPILEAMACRTPVIGTPAGAAPQLITPEVGILVPHEDPEAMSAAIVQLGQLSDPEWQCLSTAAQKRAATYTWAEATRQFESGLYQAIQGST